MNQTTNLTTVTEGDLLWQPSEAQKQATGLVAYQHWLAHTHGITHQHYAELWQWSIDNMDLFWQTIWDYFSVIADGSPDPVLASAKMPGADWFPNARLNYTEHIFRHATKHSPAIIARSEDAGVREISWAELERDVGALAACMRELGIVAGDRVASVLSNRPETIVALLASASIGAIWTSCSPDMGVTVVLDRLRQIEPKLLFASDSYSYNGKAHDRTDVVSNLLAELTSITNVVHVTGPIANLDVTFKTTWRDTMPWTGALAKPSPIHYTRLAFSHPLWIVYSSGTTGMPKAMVHGHGGVVLTHLKTLALQQDIRPGDRMTFMGSTGWIVWNLQVGALLVGASIVIYDGNPTWPNNQSLWRFIAEQKINAIGFGAAYLINAMKDGLRPRDFADLSHLRTIFSTGSPLPCDAYAWVYQSVKPDIWLASISGGTDIAGGFVSGSPTLPVTAGEIQCAELAVAAYAFNEAGEVVVDEVGELVITKPMPSMPLYFWHDKDNKRYLESYFETYAGYWRHGDWIRFTQRGSSVIYGRSDSTINRFGIRMGTAEIYRVVEELAEVRDSLVVDLEYLGRPSYMPLFVVLQNNHVLDEALKNRITDAIRTRASSRHIPNDIFQIYEVPRTLTGKKMEVPVRKVLLGMARDKVASPDAMQNPASFDYFENMAKQLNPNKTAN